MAGLDSLKVGGNKRTFLNQVRCGVRWQCDAQEVAVCGRVGLHVRGHDFGVMAEVLEKGGASPSAFDTHGVEREASQEVFQGTPYAKTMALEGREFCCCCGGGDTDKEGFFGEGASGTFDGVDEEVLAWMGFV